MCGRFALGIPRAEIQAQAENGYELRLGEWIDQDYFIPRYNIAPRTFAPVIHRRDPAPSQQGDSSTSDDELVMHTMKWGLVPHWSKHEDKTLSTTNARSENLVEGRGMWAGIRGKKRCAVVCEGYYEWLKKGKERFPHFTKQENGHLMLLAGLYDCVTLEGQTEPLWTFTIVTTSANKEFSWLHDRQPVILSTHHALTAWLDTSSQSWTSALTKLVEPYHDKNAPLICYQVPKEVGKVGTESPTFVQPIAERKDGIQAMFAKQAKLSQNSTTSQPSTPTKGKKRQRTQSPPLKKEVKTEPSEVSGEPLNKKPKVEKMIRILNISTRHHDRRRQRLAMVIRRRYLERRRPGSNQRRIRPQRRKLEKSPHSSRNKCRPPISLSPQLALVCLTVGESCDLDKVHCIHLRKTVYNIIGATSLQSSPTMPNATISEEAWDIIKYLFRDTRRAIMKDSGVISALHFLTTEESVSTDAVPHIPLEIPPSDNRLDALNEHIKKYFPVHDVSSQGTWCSPDSILPVVVERDEPLLIHGRIVAALNSPQTERNYRRLVFLVTVIVIHHLGHSIVAAFNPDHHGLCEDIDDFPYHACHFARERNGKSILIPDPGFMAEEVIFGGIIGLVFKEEREGGYPPRLLHADFSHIAHFIIRCRDNRTYQIPSEEIDSRVENMDLRPFDISHLQRVRGLRRIPERTCAFFNGDHIPVEFPGEGGEIPRRRPGVSRTPTPSDSYESRNESPRSSQRRSRHEGRERGGSSQRVREQVPIEPRGSHVPIDSHERQESQDTYTTDTTATTSTTSMGLPRDGEQTPRDSLELEREYRQSRGFDDWTDLEQHREEIPGALPSHYEGDPGAFHHEPPPDEFPPDAFHDAPHNGFQDAPHDGLHASSHDEYPEQQFGFPSEDPSQRRVEFAPDPVHERPPEENAEPFPDPTEEVTVPPVIPQPTPSTRGKGKKLKRRGG